ncbi:MAG TPA: hypothetical protein VI815_02590 [Candidatus Nanoarchaeia archaeon]|nr:hypothetical protein [Candidatus Nanoarchaeia archaeon]
MAGSNTGHYFLLLKEVIVKSSIMSGIFLISLGVFIFSIGLQIVINLFSLKPVSEWPTDIIAYSFGSMFILWGLLLIIDNTILIFKGKK